MKLLKSVKVYKKVCDIIISDDDVALREAKASLKATIAILKNKPMEIGLSKYAVEDINDIDKAYLEMVACRHLKLPLIIGNVGELTVREMALEDFKTLSKFKEFPFKTCEEFNEYISIHYDIFGYGLYILQKDKSIIGLAGFYNENSNCFISYMIMEKYQNQGYGFFACKYLLEYLREKTGIDRVYAKIEENHIPSIKLAKKLGVKIILN